MSPFVYPATAAAILGCLIAPASADTIANFTLDTVTADGGFITITGGFTLNLTTSTLSKITITTTEQSFITITTITDADTVPLTYWDGDLFNFSANQTVTASAYVDMDLLLIHLATVLTASDVLGPNSLPIATGSFENTTAP